MRRLITLTIGWCGIATAAAAQTAMIGVPPGSLAPKVIVFPASAVNGAGNITTALTFPNGTALNDTAGSGKLGVTGTTPMLQLGGTTSSFPAWKHLGSAVMGCRLADDSAACNIVGATVQGSSLSTNSGNTLITGAAAAAVEFKNSGATSGVQFTFGGDVTVTTCGTGTVTTGSKNSAGEITATGATACTVTFHTSPAFSNTPFCTVTDETTAAALRISAISTTSFTVANLTSGDKFMYLCTGRM